MKPEYRTLHMLERHWSAAELASISDEEVKRHQENVDQVSDMNLQAYNAAKREQERQRVEFRRQHPRANLPGDLVRNPAKPPDLQAQWQKMLKRRRAALRDLQEQRERQQQREEDRFKNQQRQVKQKRETFLDRMWRGRYNAMLKRERAVRKLIREYAAAHDIALTSRTTDGLLAELLAAIEMHIDIDPQAAYRQLIDQHREGKWPKL